MTRIAAIIAAGGSSTRFGSDKLAAILGGQSVLWRSVQAFATRSDVSLVVVAGGLAIDAKKVKCVAGGATRAETVRQALGAVPSDVEWVAVHDAARPLVSQELIDRVLAAAMEHGAAAPALPVALTIKSATGPLPAKVERTIPRDTLWAMQTPQIMRRQVLTDAFARCPIPLQRITDDLQLLELVGQAAWLVAGDERNIKITTQSDLALAEMLLTE